MTCLKYLVLHIRDKNAWVTGKAENHNMRCKITNFVFKTNKEKSVLPYTVSWAVLLGRKLAIFSAMQV